MLTSAAEVKGFSFTASGLQFQVCVAASAEVKKYELELKRGFGVITDKFGLRCLASLDKKGAAINCNELAKHSKILRESKLRYDRYKKTGSCWILSSSEHS